MTVETAGPGAAFARMAAIQGQLASISGAPRAATTGSTATATSSTSFDSVYSGALQGADALGGLGVLGQTGAATGSDVGSRAVEAAKKYLGVPYVWGGESLSEGGLDCSGLVQLAYGEVGVSMPRLGRHQAQMGTAVPSLAQAQPGDLVAFGSPVKHIAIYVGDGKMIAAPKRGDVVKIQDVYETPSAIRRIGPTVAGGTEASLASTRTSSVSGSAAAQRFQTLFDQATARYGLPKGLLESVARAESAFNPRAVSSAGALGLMQLMPGTARGLGVDPLDPAQAVDGAARMLSRDLDRFGSTKLALAAYNAGAGAVQRYGGVPPYSETQNYVRKVLGFMGAS